MREAGNETVSFIIPLITYIKNERSLTTTIRNTGIQQTPHRTIESETMTNIMGMANRFVIRKYVGNPEKLYMTKGAVPI